MSAGYCIIIGKVKSKNLGSVRDSNACSKINVMDCSRTIVSLLLSIDAAVVMAAPQSLPAEEATVARLGAGEGDRSPRVKARTATFAIEISVP